LPNDTRDLYRCLVAPIGLIGVIHVVGGIAILLTEKAAFVTSLAGFGFLDPFSKAILMIVVGFLAIVARTKFVPKHLERACIAPQEIVLLFQLGGILQAVFLGQYPNGHMPVEGDYWASVLFIVADQMPWMMLCVSHTTEFLFADCLVKRVTQYYENKIAAERATVMQAERLLSIQQETKFWAEMAK
jgi:hypothetical protein